MHLKERFWRYCNCLWLKMSKYNNYSIACVVNGLSDFKIQLNPLADIIKKEMNNSEQ